MHEICFVELTSPGTYGGVYAELMGALSTAAKQIGIGVSYRRDKLKPSVPNLIFAWYRNFITANNAHLNLPPNCIIFNLSPLSAAKTTPWLENYVASLQKHPVIDYAFFNERLLADQGNKSVFRFKFGYAALSAFQFPSKNNNYVFYGKITPHRKPILERIMRTGIPVDVVTNCWGHERDAKIAMAHAVLNIGKFESNILEVYRLWQSLCLGTAVISERGIDKELVNEWQNYVFFSDAIEPSQLEQVDLSGPARYKEDTSFQQETQRLMAWIADRAVC